MIIDDIISTERQRFAAKGYDTIMSPMSVGVDRRIVTLSISNDCYILTGVRGSTDDVQDGNTEVVIWSPSNSLQATVRQMSMLGTGIVRTFRRVIVVKTLGEASIEGAGGVISDGEQSVPAYRLEFVKLTPIKRAGK